MTSLDEFIDGVTEITENILADCPPDMDIEPTLFFMDQDDLCEALGAGSFFETDQTKVIFAAKVMPSVLGRAKAKYFAIVSFQWAMDGNNVALFDQFEAWRRDNPGVSWDENPIMAPSECVGIMYGSSDGTTGIRKADITRSEDAAPSPGEWEDIRGEWGDRSGPVMDIGGRMLDYAMEQITGKKMITERGLTQAARKISQSTEFQKMFIEAWAAMGLTPEEGMEQFGADDPEARRILTEKIRELFPEYEELLATLMNEHLPDASDDILRKTGVPEGILVMVDEDGEITPLASFLGDSLDNLLEEE